MFVVVGDDGSGRRREGKEAAHVARRVDGEKVDVGGEIVTFLLGQCVCVLQGDEAAPVRVCCFEFGDYRRADCQVGGGVEVTPKRGGVGVFLPGLCESAVPVCACLSLGARGGAPYRREAQCRGTPVGRRAMQKAMK